MGAAAKLSTGDERAMKAKIHIARKELGLDDDTYRAVLLRITGRASSAECGQSELAKLLDEFKRLGWQGAKAGPTKRTATAPVSRGADHPSAKKARALWISLYQLGVVREPSEQALEAFAARQLKCDRLQWADQGQVYKLIEALKAMAERAGWSQDLTGIAATVQTKVLKWRLANVLRAKLGRDAFKPGWMDAPDELADSIKDMAAELRALSSEAQP